MKYARPLSLLIIMALVMLFPAVVSVVGQAPGEGSAAEILAPEGEEFKVWMPKTPKQVDGKEPYQGLTLNSHLYTATGDNGSLFIFVTLSGIKSSARVETERFNSYIDAFGKWLPTKLEGRVAKAQLNYQKEVQLNGHSGREYQLEAGELSGPVHFFITRKKFYALAVLSAQKKEPLAARFLDSLSLSEKAAASVVSSGEESTRPTRRARAGTGERAAKSDGESTAIVPETGDGGARVEETAGDSPAQAQPKAPLEKGVVNDSTASQPPRQERPGAVVSDRSPPETIAPCTPQYPKRLPCKVPRSP